MLKVAVMSDDKIKVVIFLKGGIKLICNITDSIHMINLTTEEQISSFASEAKVGLDFNLTYFGKLQDSQGFDISDEIIKVQHVILEI